MPPSHPLVARALLDVGRVEGDPDLPIATRARPWCAAACSTWLRACGVAIPVVWGARSLLRLLARLGYSTDHRAPQSGDVVGWPRAGGPEAAHVGVVVVVELDRVEVVSGNSALPGTRRADRVTRRWYPRAKIKWAARPLPV